MKSIRHITVLLLLAVLHLSVQASVEISSKLLTTADGLSDNTVRHIYQDSKGFLWLATLNGLNRYDGNSFIKYYPQEGRKNSLSDHRVRKIFEDKNGFLWIKTFADTFDCYCLKNDEFIDFIGDDTYHPRYKEFLMQGENIWLWGNSDGCARISYNNGEFSSDFFNTYTGTLPTNNILFIREGIDNDAYIMTSNGLYHWKQGNITHLSKLVFNKSIFYQDQILFISSNGELWIKSHKHFQKVGSIPYPSGQAPTDALNIKEKCIIFTPTHSYVFNMKTYQIETTPSHLYIPNGIVSTDNRNNYWVQNGTGNIHYIHAKTGKTKIFPLLPKDDHYLLRREQYHILHDSHDIIWITTYGNGLFAYNPRTEELQQFTANDSHSSHIPSNFLQNIMEDRSGGIWIGAEFCGISHLKVINEGALRILPKGNGRNVIRMAHQKENGDIYIGIRDGESYIYDSNITILKSKRGKDLNVYSIYEDENGQEWIGTREDGLFIGDKQYKMSTNPHSLSNDAIFDILRDKKGRMWIGTFGGGINLAIPGEDEYHFQQIPINDYGQCWIRCLIEDRNGWIWAGTSGGLLIYHPDSILENPSNYYSYNRTNKMLKSDVIRSILEDKSGRIWIAESGEGFSVCIPDGNYSHLLFKHYDTNHGVSNNKVQAFAEDRQGMIWISTEYGISCFNPQDETFENYLFSADILGNVYCDNCAITLTDGRLAFGSNHGLIIIDPKEINKKKNTPTVTFTNLKINGISVHPNDEDSPLSSMLAYTQNLELKYYQNSFAVEFSTLDYPDSQTAKFSYKLQNYDEEWSIPSSLNFAAYKDLPSGTYYLHVKACNMAGVWGTEKAVLTIIIRSPFWATGWAFIIYIICTAIIFFVVFRTINHMNMLKNKIAIEKQLTEYKLMFFTNISHEFRTPLTLILGAIEKISHIENIPREATLPLQSMDKSSKRMLRLVNQLLEFRKVQANKLSLSLEKTDIISFLRNIYDNFNDIAEQKNMQVNFSAFTDSYPMYIDKEKVDKIAYNLLSNAFKYTPKDGKVNFSIILDEKEQKIQIQVTDTGVGIPLNRQKELFKRFMQSSFSTNSIGIGLHLSYELTMIHKGSIAYKENEKQGSIFTVCLPIDPSVYSTEDFLRPNHFLLEKEERLWDMETSKQPSEITPLNKRKILIIEDDSEIRQLLREEIGIYFKVETAADGNTGLEKARTIEPDLIICDVLMPGVTGFDLSRKLKGDFATSHIPIILLTALNSPEKQLEGIENGADAYISKPFSIKYILARISKLIEQHDKLREKFSKEPQNMNETIYLTQRDKEFMTQVTEILEKNMTRSDFTIEEFASLMQISKTTFYSKVRGLTGLPPVEYLRISRLNKAAQLLSIDKGINVSEVAYQTGFNDPLYFSRCFKQHFGVSPSAYQKGIVSQ